MTTILTSLRRRCGGFTLIEMMIVLLVISVLMCIALPAYMNIRENSRARVCRSHLRHFQDAKERWALENHRDNTAVPDVDDLIPAYLKSPLICPSNGTYTINSVGENPVCSESGHTLY